MKVKFYWHPYKYLPYELTLAAYEVSVLLEQEPIYEEDGLVVENLNGWKRYAQRMTYFREAVADDGTCIIPLQTALEASTKSDRQLACFNGDILEGFHKTDVLSPRDLESNYTLYRQSTRYSSHGLHEYRGKFNPQIVRAVGNMLRLQPGEWVLDPFCGSGTTLLEAAHMGWNAIGVDINPLAVQIAKAKIAAIRLPLEELHTYKDALSQRLSKRFNDVSFDRAFTERQIRALGGEGWQTYLPHFDYLSCWFTESVLVQLAAIMDEIAKIASTDLRLVLCIILSDILREVSLQDPADLRIRRRKSPPENAPVIPLYLENVKRKIEVILKARPYIGNVTTIQDALLGDSRYSASTVKAYPPFDGAITSPPYATALPYIDTQRLSLVLLRLIDPDEIRPIEKSLTGNREITAQERLKIEQDIETNADHLPAECILLCRKLKEAFNKDKDGFRRQNMPALIYKYLVDMALMFKNTYPLLKTHAPFALVVGKNRTHLGGQTFVIDTPHLLTLLGAHNGFTLQEALTLNTYQRFDVHQNNSIRSETLVILRKVEHAD